MISALYVQEDGCYVNQLGIDPWGETRDARSYPGPHPVIAHPPCARWSRYWSGGPSAKVRRLLGDDEGCFAAAITAVRTWGGVLEHPEATHAWVRFGLPKPAKSGGWVPTPCGGWTCCVEQGHYGHAARKATWLYYVGPRPPELVWGKSVSTLRLDAGYHSAEERRLAVKQGAVGRLSKRQRSATPVPFRDLLIHLVKRLQVWRFLQFLVGSL